MLFPAEDQISRAASSGLGRPEPLTRLLSHVLAYKAWFAAAALLGLLLTGLVLCFVTPIYEAHAVVIVDSRRNKLADSESALSSIVVDQYQSALKSELELILSTDVARYVIVSMRLLDTPEYETALTHVATAERFKAWRQGIVGGVQAVLARLGWSSAPGAAPKQPALVVGAALPGAAADDATMENAVKLFQKSFWALNDPKSLTIRMGYRSPSPQLAAAVTNAALQQYLAADEDMKAAAVERSETWLQGRITGLRRDLEIAERAVDEFRAAHSLATNRNRSPLEEQLLQLETRQLDAQGTLAAAQAKVAQNRQSGGPAALASGADVLSSRLIQELRQQEGALLVEQAQLAATQLPGNPGMRRIDQQLAQLRGAIHAEVARIAQSNSSDLRLAETRLADVSSQVQAARARITAANAADIGLRSLEANAAAKRAVLDTFTQRYDQNAGTPLTPPDSRVVSWASAPVDASSPKYGLVLAGGMLTAVLLAFLWSLGIERLRHGFDSVQELEDELGLIVAGITPFLPRLKRGRRPLPVGRASSPIRELALTVRALAYQPSANSVSRIVLITSALAGEGKSLLALALARSVADGGQRCLLIDADVRDPSLHASLGVPAMPGLVELAFDRAPEGAVIRQADGERFDFLPAGRPTSDTLSPFTAAAFGERLADLKSRYDVIVIDSAPVLLAAEGLVLIGAADLTLFLVKWRTTSREVARKAALLVTRCSTGPCLAVLSQVGLRRLRGKQRDMEHQYLNAYGLARAMARK